MQLPRIIMPSFHSRRVIAFGLAFAAPLAVGCSSPLDRSSVTDGETPVASNPPATIDGGATNADAATNEAGLAPKIVHHVSGVVVSTFVGSGVAGSHDGNGATAQLLNPVDVAIDGRGDLLVTEWDGNRVRKVTPAGDVTTVTSATVLHGPFALASTSSGSLVVQADDDENGIDSDSSGALWSIDSTGAATLLIGGLGRPRGLAPLADGKLVVVDHARHTVQLFDPATARMAPLAGCRETPGFIDGPGTIARFNMPYGAAIFPDGSILVADWMNHRLRKIEWDGTVSTFVGDGTRGMVDGPRLSAQIDDVRSVAIDAAGIVYFTDVGNHSIRRVNAAGDVETLAGDGTDGFRDGDGEAARFYGQEGLAVTPDGKTIYVADGTRGDPNVPYHRVRKLAVP